jgi:hypothetical protein
MLPNLKFYQPRIDQCLIKNQKRSAHAKNLALVDMSSAFVVLGLGISVSFLLFITEVIYKRIQNHYFR